MSGLAVTEQVVQGHPAPVRQALGAPRARGLLAAYLAFSVGELAVWVAVLVWAYGEGGVGAVGVVSVAQLGPAAVLAPVVAARLARLPAPAALMLGYAAQGLAYVTLALVLWADAPYAAVCAAAALASVAATCTRPVHYALLSATASNRSALVAGNTASGAIESAAAFLGPLACGVLIGPAGPQGVVLVMAGGSLLAVLLAAGVRDAPPRRPRIVVPQQRTATLAPAPPPRSTLREVLGDRTARRVVRITFAEYVLFGALDSLLVVLALDQLDMSAGGPGLLGCAEGVGGLLGTALALRLVGRDRLARVLWLSALCFALPVALAGFAPVPLAALLLMGVAGAGKLVFDVALRTLTQHCVPQRLLVPVFGLQESLMMTGLAVGSALAPLLVSVVGLQGAFALVALVLPLAVLSRRAAPW